MPRTLLIEAACRLQAALCKNTEIVKVVRSQVLRAILPQLISRDNKSLMTF